MLIPLRSSVCTEPFRRPIWLVDIARMCGLAATSPYTLQDVRHGRVGPCPATDHIGCFRRLAIAYKRRDKDSVLEWCPYSGVGPAQR
eukprot:355524-Chlamydomonas_euryale.AAC.34